MNTVKSSPYRASQFIDSFDENDTAKAMAFRNAKFDEGLNTVQSSINSAAQLPTITEEDRQYLHTKISDLVAKANSTSGMDLSNSMNVKGLESEALDIYNDDTIVSAVTSARNAQNQSALITKYKTEPKLNGNYGIANEDDYNNQLLKYKKARAEGKSSVFSYQYKNFFDVDTNLQKDLKKLQTDAYSELDKLYFNRIEEITPERIQAVVNNKLSADPRYSEQIKINAAFKYKNSTLDDLIHEKNKEQREEYGYLLGNKQKALDNLMANVSKNSTTNKDLIDRTNVQIAQEKSYIKQLETDPNSILFNDNGKINIKPATGLDRSSLEYNLTAGHLLKQMQGTYVAKKQTSSYNPAILAEANYNANINDAKNDQYWKQKDYDLKVQTAMWTQQNAIAKSTKESEKDAPVIALNPITETSIKEDPEKYFNDEIETVKKSTVDNLTSLMFDKLNRVAAINPIYAQEFLAGAFSKEGKPGEIQVNAKNLAALQKAYEEGGDGTHKQVISKALVESALKTLRQVSIDGRKAWTENGAEVSAENIGAMNDYILQVQHVRSLKNMQVQAENQAFKESGITREQWKLMSNDIKESNNPSYDALDELGTLGGGKIKNLPKISKYTNDKYEKTKSKIKEYLGKHTEEIQRGYVQYFDPKAKNYDVLNDVVLANIQDRQSNAGSGDPNGLSITNTTFGTQIKFKDSVIDAKNIETTFYDSRQNKVYLKVKTGTGTDATTQTLSFPMSIDRFPPGFVSDKLVESNRPISMTKNLNYANGNMWSANGNPQEFYVQEVDHAIKAIFRKVNPRDVTDDRVYVTVKPDIKGFVGTEKEFPSAEQANQDLTNLFKDRVRDLNKQVRDKKITVTEKNNRIIKIIETLNQ